MYVCDRKALSMFVHPKYFSKKRKEMKRKKSHFFYAVGLFLFDLSLWFGIIMCTHSHLMMTKSSPNTLPYSYCSRGANICEMT